MSKEFFVNLVEINDTKLSKISNIFIISLIILSVITFSVETIPNLDKDTRKILTQFEVFSIIVFTIEYLIRLYISDKKLSYIFSFYGLVDLLAILPFYLSLMVDLRTLRILRLFIVFSSVIIVDKR